MFHDLSSCVVHKYVNMEIITLTTINIDDQGRINIHIKL